MKEKFDTLLSDLKERHCVSLHYDKIMFYIDGFGEIQFWDLSVPNENQLCLHNNGGKIFFNDYKFEDIEGKPSLLHLYMNENIVSTFTLPKPSRIAGNHNTFYVEEFTRTMEDVLNKNVREKGDWAYCNLEQVITGIKHNLGKLKLKADPEVFRKSCIDVANYAVMAYYLFEGEKKND